MKKQLVSTVLAALAIASVVTLTACSGGAGATKPNSPPTDGVITVGLLNDIGQPPDPDIYYANNGLAIVLNAYEGLVQYKDGGTDNTIAPRLAESWTASPDNSVFTFKLRPNVTFHDGTAFTSEAVKTAVQRRLLLNGGAAYMVQGVASVATPDPLTAVISLTAPNSAFLDYLASPFGLKMESPTALAKNAGTDNAQTYLQTHDVGTGPYILTGAQIGAKYSMSRYDQYWGTKAPFTKVELPVFNDVSALQLAIDHGDVSVSVANLPSSSLKKYSNNPKFNSDLLPTFQAALVLTNPSKPFFATKEARAAFMQLIDQKKLVDEVLGARSEPATTLYAKGMIKDGSDKQKIKFDPKAMKAYAKSLPTGTPMVIGYASDNTNAQQMSNIVAASMQANGIKATAQSYPTSQVFGWATDPTKGPDAFIDGNNGSDGGNPYMWGHVFWDKSGGINYFLCDDATVDSELNQAVQTGDSALYGKAAQTYSALGCYMTLSNNKDWVVSQKWVAGVPTAHNIGANELNFSKLSISK